MKRMICGPKLVGVATAALASLAIPAQAGQPGLPSATEPTPAEATNNPSLKPADAAATPREASGANDTAAAITSAGIGEILRMSQAGVSTEVMLAYVQNSPIDYRLSPADLVALKQQAVPDELTMAIIKRGAAAPTQSSAPTGVQGASSGVASANGKPAASSAPRVTLNYIDPEGYDFFYYHYLYPRALASANDRLYGSYPSFYYGAPYGYRYYPSPVFGPRSLSRRFPPY